MGVIHKLKSEVRDFVLAQKKANPALSCRKLTALVLENFKIEVSKSSINAVMKEAGLSAPVGRTPKKKRHIVMPSLPILLGDGSNKVEAKLSLPQPEEENKANEDANKEVLRKQEEKLVKEAEEKARIELEQKKAQEAKLEAEKIQRAKLEKEKQAREEEQRQREEAARKAAEAEEKELQRKQEEERLAKEAEEKAESLRLAKIEEEKKAQEEISRRQKEEELAKEAEERDRIELEQKKAQEAKLEAEKTQLAKLEKEKQAREEKQRLQEEVARKAAEDAEKELFRKQKEEELAKEAREKAKLDEARWQKEEKKALDEAVRRAKEEAEIFGTFDPDKTLEEWIEEVKEKARLQVERKRKEEAAETKKETQASQAVPEPKQEVRKQEEAENAQLAKIEEERKIQEEADKKAAEAEEKELQRKQEEERLAKEAEEKARLEAEKPVQEEEAKPELEETEKKADYNPNKTWEGWDSGAQEKPGKKEQAKTGAEPETEKPLTPEPEAPAEEEKIQEKEEEVKEEPAIINQEKAVEKDKEEGPQEKPVEEKKKEEQEERTTQETKPEEIEAPAQKENKEAREELAASQPAEKAATIQPVRENTLLDGSGILLLRAADYLIGARERIISAIEARTGKEKDGLNDTIENLIYLPLTKEKIDKAVLDKLSGYLTKLDNIKVMNLDISRVIASALQEVRVAKVTLSDGGSFYLDGQMYSIWSSTHIPYNFAAPIHNFKEKLNKCFVENEPLVLFNAPGYDIPSQEFFNFIQANETKANCITGINIYGNKFNELEVLPINKSERCYYVFAIWPWQFTECRKVKGMGEFRQLHLEAQNKDYYIADIEMELTHPDLDKKAALTGCALKTSPNEKTRLVILSNFASGAKTSEEIAGLYLNHWPNLEEAFGDYSHKIELFTYNSNAQLFFSAESLSLELDKISSVEDLFKNYLLALDAYVRFHFLPNGYEQKDFGLAKEQFYNLSVKLTQVNGNCLASFDLSPDSPLAKELSYACRRVNEKEVVLSNGLRLYLNPE